MILLGKKLSKAKADEELSMNGFVNHQTINDRVAVAHEAVKPGPSSDHLLNSRSRCFRSRYALSSF